MAQIQVPDRRVLLPKTLDSRLKTLAGLEQETSGVLLYVPQNHGEILDYRVDSLYMTGRGSRHEIEIDPDRQAIVDRFLLSHPDYKSIEWHTHVTGNASLSTTDSHHYREELEKDPYFIGMIITKTKRTTIKAKGSGKLNTIIVPANQDFYTRERYVSDEFKKAAGELGYSSVLHLFATRKI